MRAAALGVALARAAGPALARAPRARLAPAAPALAGAPRRRLSSSAHAADAAAFVASLGHSEEEAAAVVAALKESGLGGAQLLATVKALAGRPEVGEDGGLADLVAAVREDLARRAGKRVVSFTVVPPRVWEAADAAVAAGELDGAAARERMARDGITVEALEGLSIADVARHGSGRGSNLLRELLECACSGVMACSTCHVVVERGWFERVGEPDEDELDMLDLAYEPAPTSRLGCQLVLSPQLDGLLLRLPRGAHNMMDHIPFPDA